MARSVRHLRTPQCARNRGGITSTSDHAAPSDCNPVRPIPAERPELLRPQHPRRHRGAAAPRVVAARRPDRLDRHRVHPALRRGRLAAGRLADSTRRTWPRRRGPAVERDDRRLEWPRASLLFTRALGWSREALRARRRLLDRRPLSIGKARPRHRRVHARSARRPRPELRGGRRGGPGLGWRAAFSSPACLASRRRVVLRAAGAGTGAASRTRSGAKKERLRSLFSRKP